MDQKLDPPIIQARALSQSAVFCHHDQLASCGLADLRATHALFNSIRAGVPLMETGIFESMMPKIHSQHDHASFFNQRRRFRHARGPQSSSLVETAGDGPQHDSAFPVLLEEFSSGDAVPSWGTSPSVTTSPAECPKPPFSPPPVIVVERNWASPEGFLYSYGLFPQTIPQVCR